MAQLSLELPQILIPFIISGHQIIRGGDKKILQLVEYPPNDTIFGGEELKS